MKKYCIILYFIFLLYCANNPVKTFFQKEYSPVVVLTYHDEISSVVILSEELNLKYEIYRPEEPYTHNAFSVITLGENFPIEKFKEILTFIRNYYPELRYVQLIHNQKNLPPQNLYTLIIGNPTEIAIKNNLKAWNENDFKKIQELKSKEDIHSFILQKNQGSSSSKPTGQ